MLELNNIYNMDCLEGLKQLDDSSINLCITSPPYNLEDVSIKKKVTYNSFKDDAPFQDYLAWLKGIFSELYRVLTPDGRCVINIGDKANGSVPTHHFITQLMLDIGYKYYTTIVWEKSQVAGRTSWGSFNLPSQPSFPTPFEFILVFYKDEKKLQRRGETDLVKQDFIDWSLALWRFTPETRMKKMGHPAMFSPELPKRCIKMFSYIGDSVLDVFSGLGTTCLVAKELNRKYIGFEIDKLYYDKSLERLDAKN